MKFAELSKLINKQKVRDIRNYNRAQSEAAVTHGRSIKSATRRIAIGQGKMYALNYKHGNSISNFDDIVKAADEFYADLYSTQTRHVMKIQRRLL